MQGHAPRNNRELSNRNLIYFHNLQFGGKARATSRSSTCPSNMWKNRRTPPPLIGLNQVIFVLVLPLDFPSMAVTPVTVPLEPDFAVALSKTPATLWFVASLVVNVLAPRPDNENFVAATKRLLLFCWQLRPAASVPVLISPSGQPVSHLPAGVKYLPLPHSVHLSFFTGSHVLQSVSQSLVHESEQ